MRLSNCFFLTWSLLTTTLLHAAQPDAPADRPEAVPLPTDAESEVATRTAPPHRPDANAAILPPFPRSTSIEIPAEWLTGVRDLTLGISDAEREPYYGVLAHARQFELAPLHAAGRKTSERAARQFQTDPKNKGRTFSLFADIVRHPERYRGKPVTLRGYIQRLETIDAGENDEGLTTLHQAYLFTGDSLQSPYVVVCTEIPSDIPVPSKGNPTNDVVVTGYFFKLWSYEAERGKWGAPLILAKKLEWHPRPTPIAARTGFKVALGTGLAILVLGLVLVILKQRRDDRRFRAANATLRGTATAQDLAALKQLEQEL